jgi:hypothetical protein
VFNIESETFAHDVALGGKFDDMRDVPAPQNNDLSKPDFRRRLASWRRTGAFAGRLIRVSLVMSDRTLTLTLTGDDAERLARVMERGNFTTAEEAVGEALAALEELADPILDVWLQDVVAARIDAHAATPSRSVRLEDARRRVLGAG